MMCATVALGVLVLILAFSCRRLWLATQDTGMRDWAFSLEKQLREAADLLHEQDTVLSQVGEPFDHAGVDLEFTENTQASDDLKLLGSILRTRSQHAGSPFDLAWAHQSLAELGERYGIEPLSGGPYTLRNLVRIAEEIFEIVLTKMKHSHDREIRKELAERARKAFPV